jgi:tRNA threonylcarbamoyladenosine biosynthesis protein TsaB
MSLILNIDTALETASVCLAKAGEPLQLLVNDHQRDHASWLHTAILEVFQKTGYSLQEIAAVAVSIGPGSFTGLRIGLSAAKGLCYVQNIPLITIGTLDMLAFAVKDEVTDLVCPLIDARRMEVFMALYNKSRELLIPPQAMIIDESSFAELLSVNQIIFLGNGIKKLQSLISNTNARFSSQTANAAHAAHLSEILFRKNQFADLIYTEPYYIKDFYSSSHTLV